MKDLARKAMLLGIGVYAVTKEKAEEVARELLKKGEANEADVKNLALKIESEIKKKQKELLNLAEKEAKNLLRKAEGFANLRESRGKAKKHKKKK